MMLEWLSEEHNDPSLGKGAKLIEDAVAKVILDGKSVTKDVGGNANTEQCSEAVIAALET